MGPVRALVLIAALAVGACTPAYPGEPVGSFSVTGRLDRNTCGPEALPARNPLTFLVEIRERDGEAFWRLADRPVVSGVVTDDDTYEFVAHANVGLIAPEPDLGVAGCSLVQLETVEVSVETVEQDDEADPEVADAGAPVSDAGDPAADADADADAGAMVEMALTGTNSIQLTPTAGSDCTAATVSAGGPFLALPCRVDYTLTGTERDAF